MVVGCCWSLVMLRCCGQFFSVSLTRCMRSGHFGSVAAATRVAAGHWQGGKWGRKMMVNDV